MSEAISVIGDCFVGFSNLLAMTNRDTKSLLRNKRAFLLRKVK
jgi:hypothetical protein